MTNPNPPTIGPPRFGDLQPAPANPETAPLNLTRAERERIGYLCRDAAQEAGGALDIDAESLYALAAKVDPWHDRDGNPSDAEARFLTLRAWRLREANARILPPYIIATDATLHAIAAANPATLADLGNVRGFGPHKVATYGDAILAAIGGAA